MCNGSGGKYFVYLSINSKNYFMALEEVTTEVEVEDPKKKKKKLVSMKKSTSTAIYEAPYPFKNEAEKIAYGKNMQRIVKPGYGEMGYKARPMSEMSEMAARKTNSPKITMMKKLGEVAGQAARKALSKKKKLM
jgi:hypothetical protein